MLAMLPAASIDVAASQCRRSDDTIPTISISSCKISACWGWAYQDARVHVQLGLLAAGQPDKHRPAARARAPQSRVDGLDRQPTGISEHLTSNVRMCISDIHVPTWMLPDASKTTVGSAPRPLSLASSAPTLATRVASIATTAPAVHQRRMSE